MSLAKNFNKALHGQLKIYAAWYPVANTFNVGDFGLIDGGVFRRLGDVSEFGVDFQTASGKPASIDFASAGTRSIRTVAGVEVPALSEIGEVEAKLTFDFSQANSNVIKASLDVLEMQNIYQVSRQLAKHDDWEKRFKIVWAVYTGKQCVIISTSEAGTKVEFSGKANLLQQIEAGQVEVSPSIESSSDRVFKSVGKTGVVGLGLFKLGWFDRVKVLAAGDRIDEDDDVKLEKDWGDDLADDL
ncbi:MAG: hypothetical protein QGF59_04865 [Pirellulaceae bacterium]|nr:hypothetical protein [Pirellulaceae bacterium]MDP6717956.1 hypothetical protein [Pirellulaceae bacterium]